MDNALPIHLLQVSPFQMARFFCAKWHCFTLKQLIHALPTRHADTTRDDSLLLGVLFHNVLHAPFESSLSDFGSLHCRYELTYQPARIFQFTFDWHDIDALHQRTLLQMCYYIKVFLWAVCDTPHILAVSTSPR